MPCNLQPAIAGLNSNPRLALVGSWSEQVMRMGWSYATKPMNPVSPEGSSSMDILCAVGLTELTIRLPPVGVLSKVGALLIFISHDYPLYHGLYLFGIFCVTVNLFFMV